MYLHVRLQALLSCPTASIHTEKPTKDILQVHNTFPLAIDDDLPVNKFLICSLFSFLYWIKNASPKSCVLVTYSVG
jgi:hypothetical protein